MLVPGASLQLVLDLFGVFVAAVTGGLVAVRRSLDIFGVLVLAISAGLGGGIVRDVLIDRLPPWAFDDWRYVLTATAAGVLAYYAHPVMARP